jgi:hypothetical protein
MKGGIKVTDDSRPLQQEWWREEHSDWLPPKMVKRLTDAGINTVGEVRSAGPERLLEIDGIGQSALKKIKSWLRALDERSGAQA